MNIFKKALLLVLGAGLVVVPSTLDKVEAVSAAGTDKWSAIGTINGTNWNTDFPLSYVKSADKVVADGSYNGYELDIDLVQNNEFKIRLNNSWDKSIGWDGSTSLGISTYLSNSGGNFKVKTTGRYTLWVRDDNVANYGNKSYGFGIAKCPQYTITFNSDGGSSVTSITNYRKTENISLAVPTKDGYEFMGWSDGTTTYNLTYPSLNSNVTLTAQWQEVKATDCRVTYSVNGTEFHVVAPIGSTVEENAPIEDIEKESYRVIEWETTGTFTEDTVVYAKKYYKMIDEVKGELNFAYNYTSELEKLVVFQCPITDNDGVPTITATNADNETVNVNMIWSKDDNNKKEWFAYVDVEYTKLTFNWKNNGKDQSYSCERSLTNNAIWWDSATSHGTWEYVDAFNNSKIGPTVCKINSVTDMKLRVGTLALLASDYKGVETFGIRIAKGNTIADDNYYGPTWTAEDVAKVDVNGNADEEGEYIRWNAVINNIPTENYTTEFTAVAYVVINGQKHDICESARSISVLSLATTYAETLNGYEQRACQYIVDTCAKA